MEETLLLRAFNSMRYPVSQRGIRTTGIAVMDELWSE